MLVEARGITDEVFRAEAHSGVYPRVDPGVDSAPSQWRVLCEPDFRYRADTSEAHPLWAAGRSRRYVPGDWFAIAQGLFLGHYAYIITKDRKSERRP